MLPRLNVVFPSFVRPAPSADAAAEAAAAVAAPFSVVHPSPIAITRLRCMDELVASDKEIYYQIQAASTSFDDFLIRYEQYSAISRATCPWASVARTARTMVDRGIPCTNAFTKMYEMCFDTEVGELIREHAATLRPLRVACLAEAPGTFPLAIAYYLGRIQPLMLDPIPGAPTEAHRYTYRCTTLPPTEVERKALTDQYSLIGRNVDKWFMMDHTSVADTVRMGMELGEGTYDLVTGDIGKPIYTVAVTDRELFLEQFGQFVSALILLRDGGVACLKMFKSLEFGQISMLHVAVALFGRVRWFKPRTSHTSNRETYWILSGFHRSAFTAPGVTGAAPLRESLLGILGSYLTLRDAHYAAAPGDRFGIKQPPVYPMFIDRVDEHLIDMLCRVRSIGRCQRAGISKEADMIWKSVVVAAQPPGVAIVAPAVHPTGVIYRMQLRRMEGIAGPFADAWVQRYPIGPIGKRIYDLTHFDPSQLPASVPTTQRGSPHSSRAPRGRYPQRGRRRGSYGRCMAAEEPEAVEEEPEETAEEPDAVEEPEPEDG